MEALKSSRAFLAMDRLVDESAAARKSSQARQQAAKSGGRISRSGRDGPKISMLGWQIRAVARVGMLVCQGMVRSAAERKAALETDADAPLGIPHADARI